MHGPRVLTKLLVMKTTTSVFALLCGLPLVISSARGEFHRDRLQQLIATGVIPQRGLWPDRNVASEAYATLFHGRSPTQNRPEFIALSVLVHSIRAVDRRREIVVLTIEGVLTTPAADPGLASLKAAYEPLTLDVVPELNALTAVASRRHCSNALKSSPRRVTQMFTKLAIFNLTQFSRVLYLDLDTMVNAPLDELWSVKFEPQEVVAAATAIKAKHDKREFSCKWLEPPGPNSGHGFNAGVMLLRPSMELYSFFRTSMADSNFHIDCTNGDQPMLHEVLRGKRPPRHKNASHIRCIGQSFNCRDSYLIKSVFGPPMDPPDVRSYLRTRCDSAMGNLGSDERMGSLMKKNIRMWHVAKAQRPTARAPLPHVVHFAMDDKPWSKAHAWRRQGPNTTFFYALWHRHFLELQRSGLLPAELPGASL